MSTLLSPFFRLNRRLSAILGRRLPYRPDEPFAIYDRTVESLVRRHPGATVVDAGGGRRCSFAHAIGEVSGTRVVAVDISAEDLAANRDVDETRVADITDSLPFVDGEVDLLVSRTVLKHLPDVDAFVRESARVLRAGGTTVHLAPCRYALFAVVARLIPFDLAKRILHGLHPETVGVVEFPVYYDRCYPSAIRRTFERHGFVDVDVRVSWAQADYFDAFFPAYSLAVIYESTVRALGLRDLAAYLVVSARR